MKLKYIFIFLTIQSQQLQKYRNFLKRIEGVGGFTYVYRATPLEETKKIMERELQVWYNMMSKLVMKFEKSLKKFCACNPISILVYYFAN